MTQLQALRKASTTFRSPNSNTTRPSSGSRCARRLKSISEQTRICCPQHILVSDDSEASIHAPFRGDTRWAPGARGSGGFYPRPLVGATMGPRPDRPCHGVSIHATVMGATSGSITPISLTQFLSTPP